MSDAKRRCVLLWLVRFGCVRRMTICRVSLTDSRQSASSEGGMYRGRKLSATKHNWNLDLLQHFVVYGLTQLLRSVLGFERSAELLAACIVWRDAQRTRRTNTTTHTGGKARDLPTGCCRNLQRNAGKQRTHPIMGGRIVHLYVPVRHARHTWTRDKAISLHPTKKKGSTPPPHPCQGRGRSEPCKTRGSSLVTTWCPSGHPLPTLPIYRELRDRIVKRRVFCVRTHACDADSGHHHHDAPPLKMRHQRPTTNKRGNQRKGRQTGSVTSSRMHLLANPTENRRQAKHWPKFHPPPARSFHLNKNPRETRPV